MLNIEDMYLEMGIRREVYDFGSQIEGTLKERFDAIDKDGRVQSVESHACNAEM